MKLSGNTIHLLILFILFSTVNGYLFASLGVNVVTDSHRYLSYAHDITERGLFFQEHNAWYIGYVLFIIMAKSLSHYNLSIILLQVFFHAIGTIALYKTSIHLFNDSKTALITAAIFILWIEIPSWNFYILPESFYMSIISVSLYALTRFLKNSRNFIITIILAVIVFLTKPTGIAFLFGTIISLISLRFYDSGLFRNRLNLTIAIIAILVGSYFLLNAMLNSYIIIENYVAGDIVYGISTLPTHPNYHLLHFENVKELSIPDKTLPPLQRILLFILHNPLYFFKLSLSKVFYFFAHVKPYYSSWHNAFIVLTLYPIYYFSAKTLLKRNFNKHFRYFTITYIIVHTLIVALTVEEWDGRFLMPLMPVLILLAAPAISTIISFLEIRFGRNKQPINQ